MKVRTSFVSNSSSSSFIIGLGIVEDYSKLQSVLKDLAPYHQTDILVMNKSSYVNTEHYHSAIVTDSNISLECAYTDDKVELALDPTKDELILLIDIHNNEGDYSPESHFYQCVYEGEELGVNHFSLGEQKLLALGENEGVINFQSTFGCGRNG
jgi:hypothetical protein